MKSLPLFILALFFVTMVSALPPSYETVEFSTDYYSLFEKDVTYSEVVNIGTSISEYSNFELTLWGDWKSGFVYVDIDGVSCSPNGWLTPSADGYKIRFDCTEAINNAPNKNQITLNYHTDKDANNVYGTVKATYLTKGRPYLEVHGTEYVPDQQAKVWLQLLNSTGDAIDDAVCYTDIYSPDNLQYIERALMSAIGEEGIYYYDLTTPFEQGVYPVVALCYYTASVNPVNASSYALYEGQVEGGTVLSNTYIQDNVYFEFSTKKNVYPINRIDVNFTYGDFYNQCGNVSELFLTGMSFYFNGIWNTGTINHDVHLYVWNYTNNSWIEMPNHIFGGLGNTKQTVTNSIDTNNITKSLGITASNPLKIRYFDTAIDEGSKSFDIDRLYASCDQLDNPEWQEVKGSSEMHITADKYWVTQVLNGEISNDTWTGNFTYSFLIESVTGINRTDEVYIDLPTPFPCHHVLDATVEGQQVNYTLGDPDNPDISGCRVTFDYDLVPETNFNAEVIAENWFKEIEQNWITESTLEYDIINIACENYQEANGLDNYTIPATSPLNYSYDTYWNTCQQYLDQFYHFNNTYFNEFQTLSGNFTEDEMNYLNNQWRHLMEVDNRLHDMAISIMNGMQTGADYSLAVLSDPYPPANPFYTLYWANLSTSRFIYSLQSVNPDLVWSYSNRSLTDFDFFGNATEINLTGLNTSSISESVWNYNGDISNGLIDQFVDRFWNFTGTISSVILDSIGLNVWEQPSRNLTYTPDETNYTLINDGIWNYTGRYTHGIIIP